MISISKTKPTDTQTDSGRWVSEEPTLRGAIKDLGIRAVATISVGLRALLGSRAGDSFGILMYHRIAPHVPGVPRPQFNVTPDRFRRQIAGLLGRGFTVWPLRKVIEYHLHGIAVPPRTVVITFDDGFETVYTRAWPVLRELDVPGTVFVSTAYLNSASPFPFDSWGINYSDRVPPETFRPMTTAQCRELSDSGLVELGAHTHTHQDFRGRTDVFREDMQASVDIMRSRFSVEEPTFAFPYGDSRFGFASDEMSIVAKQSGAICSLTTDAELVDLRTDPFHWGRFNVFPWDTGATLAAKLDGWYGWAPRLRYNVYKVFKVLCMGQGPGARDWGKGID